MGYRTFVKLSLNENGIVQTESTFNNVSKTKLSSYPLTNDYIHFEEYNGKFQCDFSEHNINLLDFLDSSLHDDLLSELKRIQDFEDLAGVEVSQRSLQDLLIKLQEKEKEIKEHEFGLEHIYTWVEDGEYHRCSSYLTLKTPVLTTCYAIFEIMSFLRDDLRELNSLKNSIQYAQDSLEKAEQKYESCTDLIFKSSMLKEFKDKVKELKISLEEIEKSLNYPDVSIILNGVSENTSESFFVKHNLVSILNKLNIKKITK